jgi:hypothetical protein
VPLACPSCGRSIPARDVNEARRLAVCRPCAELIPFDGAPLVLVAGRPSALRLVERRDGRVFRFDVTPHRRDAHRSLIESAWWLPFLAVMIFLQARWTFSWTDLFIYLGPMSALAFGVVAAVRRRRRRLILDDNGLRGGANVPPLPLLDIDRFESLDEPGATRMLRKLDVLVVTREGRALPLGLHLASPEHVRYLAARLNRALDELRAPETYRG